MLPVEAYTASPEGKAAGWCPAAGEEEQLEEGLRRAASSPHFNYMQEKSLNTEVLTWPTPPHTGTQSSAWAVPYLANSHGLGLIPAYLGPGPTAKGDVPQTIYETCWAP